MINFRKYDCKLTFSDFCLQLVKAKLFERTALKELCIFPSPSYFDCCNSVIFNTTNNVSVRRIYHVCFFELH